MPAVSSGPRARRPLTILVADDTASDRLILEAIVRQEGHRVLSASDGVEAVAVFAQERPDLVLLDALMPRMDGFSAARQIKALAGEALVPIIFLTSLTDTESLVKCLDAGGDDFLSKPYNRVILQAKIKAFNRMRELHATMLAQRDQIARHNEHFLQEQAVAKQVFDNIAHSGCLNASNVRYYLSSLAVFNGDILVAAMRPSGNMMVLLGDFTGHGLPAAVGAIPLASTFYGMVHKGFSMTDVLREINGKLKSILPVGIFCCATIVDINFHKRRMRVWNGGLPDSFLYHPLRPADAGRIEPIKSTHLPLGVLANKDFRDDSQVFALEEGDRLFMWSDGIHEARNRANEMFGEERLLQVFVDNPPPERLFDNILASVQQFVGDTEKNDDLSLVEIVIQEPCYPTPPAPDSAYRDRSGLIEWAMSFEVEASSFRGFDPLPLLLNILVEVPGLRRHSGTLYSLLSELYSNALEHGVLRLDSTLKNSAEGFARYYELREQRLQALESGLIRFHLSHKTSAEGGTLRIRVQDSGQGFERTSVAGPGDTRYHGRGLALLEKLCDAVYYQGDGSQVEVVFSWLNDD